MALEQSTDVPGVGAFEGDAIEGLKNLDGELGLEFLEEHSQRGAHNARSDKDDIGEIGFRSRCVGSGHCVKKRLSKKHATMLCEGMEKLPWKNKNAPCSFCFHRCSGGRGRSF